MKLKGSTRARMAAKHLRRDMSLPEIILWRLLRKNQLGARFRKQVAAGPYVLDFYCAPAKLAVEVDGLATISKLVPKLTRERMIGWPRKAFSPSASRRATFWRTLKACCS